MFHRPESKFMGHQYRNHCPIFSQKSGKRPSGNEKQAWRTEINNYRIKINSFRKRAKEDQNPHQIWQCAELKRKQCGELSYRKYRQYITDVLEYGQQLLEYWRKFAVNNQTCAKRSYQFLCLKSAKVATGSPNRSRPGQRQPQHQTRASLARRVRFVRDSGSDSEPWQLQLIWPYWIAEGGEKTTQQQNSSVAKQPQWEFSQLSHLSCKVPSLPGNEEIQ